MTGSLLQLEPHEVWKQFHAITRIPRPSGYEEPIRKFLASFGRGLGLETLVDGAGNVLIRKPATQGMEGCPGVILQSHLDMVPQKNTGTAHEFTRDPVEAFIEGGWVRARGTTLGADNGLGMAAALAVLESTTMRHGPVEALFTANEEAGMTGVRGLIPGVLKGSILMNLDSEDEGELFIGCAGGLDAIATFESTRIPLPPGHAGLHISVSGLRGGHSGMDIHLGRGNANKLLARLLREGEARFGLLPGTISGGSLRNAIPRESTALAAVPEQWLKACIEALESLGMKIRAELGEADPGLRIEVQPAGPPASVIDPVTAGRLLKALNACQNGVLRMSTEMAGLVESSSNLAVVRSSDTEIVVECLLRSSVDSAMEELGESITGLFSLAGATTRLEGGYPGWKPDRSSPILRVMLNVYEGLYGKVPEVRAVHAGLECGIIGGSHPHLDMISFGPTIRHPHSPDEKLEIASVARFWEFLAATLGEIGFAEEFKPSPSGTQSPLGKMTT
jgi:dipeptidase D